MPLTTDLRSGFYFRKEMEQFLLSPGDVQERIVDGKPSIDLSLFAGARFARDRAPRHARRVDAE